MSNSISGLPSISNLPPITNVQKPASAGKTGFTDLLHDAMDNVQQAQTDAQQSVKDLLEGNGEEIHQTMIAVQKADVSFQMMMEVRNKIISAYQEVSRMNF